MSKPFHYKGCSVSLTRNTKDDDWYLIITAPTGLIEADGWIKDSATWSMGEAIAHAKKLIEG